MFFFLKEKCGFSSREFDISKMYDASTASAYYRYNVKKWYQWKKNVHQTQ